MLFRAQWVDGAIAGGEARGQFNGVIPGTTFWQLVKFLFAEYVCKLLDVVWELRYGRLSYSNLLRHGSVCFYIAIPVEIKDPVTLLQCLDCVNVRFILRFSIHTFQVRQIATVLRTSVKRNRALLPVNVGVVTFQPFMTDEQRR